jgi:tetratricopeptide (TPR) repeat protein
MSSKISLWTGLIGIGATVALVQPIAVAKSSVEIAKTAREITVLITEPNSVGSGVILQRQGEIYTVLTAAHVVKNKANYTITTSDNRKYQMIGSSIRSALESSDSIDLAVVKFKSTTNYPTAKLGNCNLLTLGMDLYVGGFPSPSKAITNSIFVFTEGKVSANGNINPKDGYSLIYSNITGRGMSGGAVLNTEGELVAIHGQGERDEDNVKTGLNLGIPINRFATVAKKMGVDLEQKVAPIPQNTAPKADDYFALAAQKYLKQDYRGSIADLNRAIQLNPNYAKAYIGRGNLKLLKLNDPQGSLADFNRALELDPRYANAYNNRGLLKLEKLNDPQGSLADYNRALELDPKFAIAYYSRGSLKQNKLNDPQGSLADYNRALELDPRYAIAYNNRGLLKVEKLNDPQGSLADYNRALELDPKYTGAYNNRGSLKKNKLNDPQGSLADYNRALELDPNLAVAYNNRGLLKVEKLNDPQGSLADYNRALELDPKYTGAYYNRGSLKANKLQDVQGGVADLNRAIEIDPNLANAYSWRGVLKYNRLNDRSGAIVDLQQAARLHQQQGNTKDYQTAIDILKKFEGQNSQPIVTTPSNAEGYYRQGDRNADAGNYREAIVDFSRSIALNSRSAPAYIGRGRSKYQLQDYPGAISDYQQALSIDPQYASAYFNLGLVKAKSKDLKGAILDMQRAVKLYQQQGKQQDAKDAIAQIARWKQTQNSSGF